MLIFIEQKFLILHHKMLLMTSQLLREFTIISNKKSYKNEKIYYNYFDYPIYFIRSGLHNNIL